jgi:hypothetical protein
MPPAEDRDMVRRSPPPDAAMKRFVLTGLFLVLGFIILGAATSYVMSGPDKPAKPHPAAASADATPKGHGGQGASQSVNTQPLQSQKGPGQSGMTGGSGSGMSGSSGRMTGSSGSQTQVPPTIIPLSTSVPPPTVRPDPSAGATPHVPALPQTDESSSRGH